MQSDEIQRLSKSNNRSVFKEDTIYILDVSIKQGINLPSKGSNDSFIRVKCNDQVFDSKVINNSLNPEWDAITRYRLKKQPQAIYFNIFNGDDKKMHHELIGYYEEQLTQYFRPNHSGKHSLDDQFSKYNIILSRF